jgi:hypothetical protein
MPSKWHERKSRSNRSRWEELGFLPEESYRLEEMSDKGGESKPMMMMRKHRRGSYRNSLTYGWTNEKWRTKVINDYVNCGMPVFHAWRSETAKQIYVGKHFYDYLKYWQFKYKKKDPNWTETPRPKKVRTGRPTKLMTKEQSAQAKLNQINIDISRAIGRNDQKERARLEREARAYYKIIYGKVS